MYVCVIACTVSTYIDSVCSIDHRPTMNSSIAIKYLACGHDGMCMHIKVKILFVYNLPQD